ncbi:MAG: acyltransferase [Nitrospirota bacterium]
MKENDYLVWPDLLKIASVYAVIMIHSAAPLLVQYCERGATDWWIGNLYDAFSRWCIPLFIMISGTFVLGNVHDQSLGRFFRKRARRVVIPFLIWSFIYFLWRIYGNNEALALSSFPVMIFTEPIYYHLWYLYVIIGLYLLAPFLDIYLKNAERQNVSYFLMLWFITASLLPMVESYFDVRIYLSTGASNTVFTLLGYFVLGYVLRDMLLRPVQMLRYLLLFLLAFFMTASGTYYVTVRQNDGIFDGIFYEYFSVNVLAMSLAIFAIGKNITLPAVVLRFEKRFGIFRTTASCVPGMYLIHAMLIEISKEGLLGFTFSQTTLHPALGIPVFAFGIFLASLAVVFIVKLIPVIRFIVP